jgi:hypothetical protein
MMTIGGESIMNSGSSTNQPLLSDPSPADHPNFGIYEGDSYYYLQTDIDITTEIYYLQYYVNSISIDEIEFEILIADESNGFVFTYVDTRYVNYAPNDLIWSKYFVIPANISDMAVYDATIEDLDARYEAEFGGSVIGSSYTTDSENHRIQINGTDGLSNSFNITALMSIDTGLYVYNEIINESKVWRTELMGWDSSSLVWVAPSNTGFSVGDTIETCSPGSGTPHFRLFEIMFLFENPETGEVVTITDVSTYEDVQFTNLLDVARLRVEGRFIPGVPESMLGSHFYEAGVDFNEFASLYNSYLINTGYTNIILDSESDWVEVSATNAGNDDEYLFSQSIDGFGFPRYNKFETRDSTGTVLDFEWEFVIGPSALVEENPPSVGVVEGQEWTLIQQIDYERNDWGYEIDNHDMHKIIQLMNLTVTHIFPLNKTNIAVCGSIITWTMNDPLNPEVKPFEPFLIFDSLNYSSIFSAGGFATDGPPMILPIGENWADFEEDFEYEFGKTIEDDEMYSIYLSATDIGFSLNNNSTIGENNSEGKSLLRMDLTSGILTNFEFESIFYCNGMEAGYETGYYKRESTSAYMIDLTDPITNSGGSLSPVLPGNQFVWETRQYRPDPNPNYARDPCEWKQEKVIIDNMIPFETAAQSALVIFGQIFKADSDNPNFEPKVWIDRNTPTTTNYWILSQICPNDLWSWIGNRFIQADLTDYTSVKNQIVEIQNFMLASSSITLADVTTVGRSISIEVTIGNEIFIFRTSANSMGVIQDQFIGRKTLDGTWLEWERTVLISAPAGYSVGAFFTDLPIPDCTTPPPPPPPEDNDDNPSNPDPSFIPGYPLGSIGLFAFAAAVFVYKKKFNRK